MGHVYSAYIGSPETAPSIYESSKHDPLYGFENGRKERESVLSEQEMEALQLKPEHRDYCAHFLKDFYQCRNDKWPWVSRCSHEKHLWDDCQFNDFVIRMKEYERERRLNERASRKAAKERAEDLE